jgi:hypothetical protein
MKEIATDIWQVDGPDLRMPGGVKMPASSTVIRLPDRSLLVYSPIAFDDAAAAAIAAAGEVAHIVAPNRYHHMFAVAAAERWPRATVHAAPGVSEKQPALKVGRELAGGERAWGDAIEVELIGGAPKINEAVLFHRPSGTLVCADLLFHVAKPGNLRARLVLAMMGTGGGRLAQSRMWSMLRKDRAAARASVDRIVSWPIARLAPCHGAAVELDAAGLAERMTRLYGGRVAPAR